MLYLQIASPKSSVLNFLDSNSFEVIISIFQRTEKVPDMERLRFYTLMHIMKLEGAVAAQDVKLISELFHLYGLYDKTKDKDRKDYRQREVAPKVDAYFAWVKESLRKVPAGGSTCKALQYSLNQEEYLQFFLTDGKVPMDNNTAERALRPFALGRKNWGNVDSIRGAEASAIMYSLVETAKANGLRVYEYLEYVLTELAAHQDDTSRDFLADLLPWSNAAQKKCSSLKKGSKKI